ncbi:hypothetical protein OPV22_010509 [Ensete ventricosum]|uniref:UBC core domain-containing protein n=1 Tax=Ensete ventricosum TaxID=4639 RepID=A0AAV8RFS4_ENSVE|nr:hypothetical protein OPV22_010509 [Ensete ventricosum]
MKENPQSGHPGFAYATVAVLFVLLLRHDVPEEAAGARYQKKVYNIIDKWSPKLALSGMMDEQNPVANETETKVCK